MALLLGIVHNYVVPAEPLWLVVNGNIVFVAINSQPGLGDGGCSGSCRLGE